MKGIGMKKGIVSITIGLMAMQLAHGAADNVPNSYQGVPITPYSIYGLMQKASPLQPEIKEQLNTWLEKPESRELFSQLLSFKFDNIQSFKAKQAQDISLLNRMVCAMKANGIMFF